MRSRRTRSRDVGSLWRVELARGLGLAATGDVDGALAAFARAQAMVPDEPEPAFARARIEERRGRAAEAERWYRLALAARPAWPLATAALARLLVTRAQPTARRAITQARRLLQTARAAEPAHPLLLLVDGELWLEEDNADAAKAAFARARAAGAEPALVDAGLARAENLAAMALAAAGRSDEAAFAFKRACDLAPSWVPPRANLAALLQRMGKRPQALAQLRRALELDPTHGPAQLNLGLLLRARGDLDGAARAFAGAAAADPPHPDARVELALTLADRGDHAAAIRLFEEELRSGRRPAAPLHANIGVAWMVAGEPERAEAALQQALAEDPDHVPALRNLAYLYGRAGRLVDAAALLRRAQGNSAAPPVSK
jgi:tetratricopeptide (TPR) repeat protein